MRIYAYIHDGREQLGVMSQSHQTLLSFESLGLCYEDTVNFIENVSQNEFEMIGMRLSEGIEGVQIDRVKIVAPIRKPRHDILCVGMNYAAHAEEFSNFQKKEYIKPQKPVYFSKRVNRAVDPDGRIALHDDISDAMDYECELAVIIGKECKNVPQDKVYEHIFGYTIVNDITARDIQRDYVQFTFGKGLDDTTPIGPCIVTPDEFSYPLHLELQTKVNGKIRQSGNTRDFIFDIPYMISDISRGITLYPGDIFITGTPSGVGAGFNPPRYLKRGDVIECQIDGIGVLKNHIG